MSSKNVVPLDLLKESIHFGELGTAERLLYQSNTSIHTSRLIKLSARTRRAQEQAHRGKGAAAAAAAHTPGDMPVPATQPVPAVPTHSCRTGEGHQRHW